MFHDQVLLIAFRKTIEIKNGQNPQTVKKYIFQTNSTTQKYS